MTYESFLTRKAIVHKDTGITGDFDINPMLFEFQSDIVKFCLRKGRAAVFADCGLGKSFIQIEWAKNVYEIEGVNVLILAPLAVAQQTINEGKKLNVKIKLCHSQEDVEEGINITNYEKIHKFDLTEFDAVVLDESSIIKHQDSKTRNLLIGSFGHARFKLCCTATPAPNDYTELGNHAEFLGAMTQSEMLSMFFVHDAAKTQDWRLKGHAQKEFWKWICSWAVNIRKPSDLGYDDAGFNLPKLNMIERILETDSKEAGMLFSMPAVTLDERRGARRASLPERVQEAARLANSNQEQWLIFCGLNNESTTLARSINDCVEVTGSDSQEHKETSLLGFADGKVRALVSKSSIAGFGLNLQKCHNIIFVSLSDSFEEFYQAVRRVWRFGQKQEVNCYIVVSNLESNVVNNIKRKEADANKMADEMVRMMADISSKEIKGITREQTTYNPTKDMALPLWINQK